MEQSPLDAAAGKIGDALLSPLESLGKVAGAFNPFSGDDLGKRAGMLGEGTLGLASAPLNAGKQFLGATGDVLRSNPVTSFAGEPINFACNAINKGEGEIKSGLSKVGEGVVQAAQNYQWNPLENDPNKSQQPLQYQYVGTKYGHTGIVEAVGSDGIIVADMNRSGNEQFSRRFVAYDSAEYKKIKGFYSPSSDPVSRQGREQALRARFNKALIGDAFSQDDRKRYTEIFNNTLKSGDLNQAESDLHEIS